jgi:hypothetical protein
MPWGAFARMTDDDVRAIYRYLRSLPAVENDTGPVLQDKGMREPVPGGPR